MAQDLPPTGDHFSAPPRKLRILLADDHEIVRQGARAVIERRADWEVCGEAGDGRSAVAMVEKLQPDIAIIDIAMPELNGLDATRQIKRALPACEVLVFTGEADDKLIHDVFAAGARSYILKNDISAHLIAAIEALSHHKHYFTSAISEVVFARYLDGKSASAGGRELTARERETLQLLAEGKSNKEVAAALGISVKTAETHRAAIMSKLSFDSFADLVRYAVRQKIIQA